MTSAPAPFEDLDLRGYRAILADFPWHFKARTALQFANWSSRRDVEKHYHTLGLEQIKSLPVRDLAEKDCHLFMWATGRCLRQAFEVMDALGFKYSTVAFRWVKLKRSLDTRQLRITPTMESDLHVGLGLTTRKNAEFVLLGRRGNCHRNAKDVREIILAPVREHSRKPDEVYARIERSCDGPYLDLFGRRQRAGWTVWGDEAHKFGGK